MYKFLMKKLYISDALLSEFFNTLLTKNFKNYCR